IAELSCTRGAGDGYDEFFNHVVSQDQIEFDFGDEIDGVLAAAINFGVTFLTAVASGLEDGHAVDADFMEGGLHGFEFRSLNYGFDFDHRSVAPLGLGRFSVLLTAYAVRCILSP